MARGYKCKFSIFAIAICVMSSWLLPVKAETSKHSVDVFTFVANEWCPQQCEHELNYKGYVIEILEAALNEVKASYTIEWVPWSRGLDMVRRGKIDGLIGPTVEGFPEYHFGKESIGHQEYCFYTNRDSTWTYKKPEDLFGQNIAYLKESGLGSLEDFITKNKIKINTHEFVQGNDIIKIEFQFLAKKRCDAVILTSDAVQYAIGRKTIPDQFRSAGCLGKETLAIGFSKVNLARSQKISKKLDEGLRAIKSNGEYHKILKKYNMR